jgi:hypothetical protein
MRTLVDRRIIVAAAAVGIAVGSGMAALPSVAGASARPAAAQVDGFSFSPGLLHLKSSTHKALQVSVFVDQSLQSGHTFSNADVTISTKGSPESHEWSFQLTNKSLKFNPATGKGTLKTGKQLKPFGSLKLTFKAVGKPHVTKCHTFKTVNQGAKSSGGFVFNTRSSGKHKWGKVARHGALAKGFITYETGPFASCGNTFTPPCQSGISWSASKSQTTGVNETSFDGSIGKRSMLFATRNTSLNKPKNAIRSDTVNVADNHMHFSVKGGKATVKVGGSGHVTGGATIAAPHSGSAFPLPCGKNGKTENTTSWQAAYKNAKSPLSIHEQIEGPLKLPNLGASADRAAIDKTTVS